MGVYRAFGLIIALWALNQYFADTFVALDGAATATLNTIEAAAEASQSELLVIP